jgi:hypothetical protein
MKELSEMVGFIVNNLNGSTMLVTADHGFMYQESALDEADKAALEVTSRIARFEAKKRYLLGRGWRESHKAWCGNTAVTAGTDPEATGSLDFWVPKGARRFHFAAGHALCMAARCRRRSWCR